MGGRPLGQRGHDNRSGRTGPRLPRLSLRHPEGRRVPAPAPALRVKGPRDALVPRGLHRARHQLRRLERGQEPPQRGYLVRETLAAQVRRALRVPQALPRGPP